MVNTPSYLWFKFIFRSSSLISSDAWRPVWILTIKPTVFLTEFFGTSGWFRLKAFFLLRCILFWDPSLWIRQVCEMTDTSGDERRWFEKHYGLWFETHDSEFCEKLFRSLDADILSSHDSFSLLEQQNWVKSVMLGIFATVCDALRFTLFWTLTVVERRWLNSSRVRRLLRRVSETNGGAEGSYMIRRYYLL